MKSSPGLQFFNTMFKNPDIYFLLVLMMFSIRRTRTCHNMQGLRHWWGTNHLTKNSRGKRNSGIMWLAWLLCNLLTRKENQLNLIVILKNESYCLQPWYRIVRIVHGQTCPRKSSRLRPLRHRRFHNNYGLWCNRLQGVNKSYVAVVSCCATDWSVDCVSTVICESTRTACKQETWR